MATALYRRYRPEAFAEVIGQEHVTGPLRAALRAGRANHAYLFSGPRGCGKTTSARILARCLNCEQGPTDTPCGTCPSCVELARGGSGSLDVVEIDAASHGGVDDARELRERAAFAPARDRYKIYIIDEAHMVTPQGFNALLKIVEEPPEHVKFVFATTEPDKVLGTIRSRTHHYPFHLVAPQVLVDYLSQLCATEGVAVGKGVLPLVVRAGAGSVRDSLSVLDQLAAGAGEEGIDYERAVGLLGYTHASLLDDVVAAFAAADGGTVFRVVDRVVSSGQDPRRFVDDLLQRLRDLVIVQAVAERSREVFPGVPDDQLERMAVQAAAFGAAQLSRAADLANAASTEMTGATSPRLHLELLCARMLLPAAEDGERGLAARLDRLERRLSVPTGPAPAGPAPAGPAPAGPAPAGGAAQAAGAAPGGSTGPAAPAPAGAGAAPGATAPAAAALRGAPGSPPAALRDEPPGPTAAAAPAPSPRAPVHDVPEVAAPAAPAAGPSDTGDPGDPGDPGTPGGSPGTDATEAVRRMWPDILDHLASTKRRTWTRVSQDCQVQSVDEHSLVLQFGKPGTMAAFAGGPHADAVRDSLAAVLGLDRQVVAVAAGAAPAPAPAPARVPPRTEPVGAPAPPPAASTSTALDGRAPQAVARTPGREQDAAHPAPRPAGAQVAAPPAPRADGERADGSSRPATSGDHGRAAAPAATSAIEPPPVEIGPDVPGPPPEPPEDEWGYPSEDPYARSGAEPTPSAATPRPGGPPSAPLRRPEGRPEGRPDAAAPASSSGDVPAPGAPPSATTATSAAPAPIPATPPAPAPTAPLRGAALVRSAVRAAGSGGPGAAPTRTRDGAPSAPPGHAGDQGGQVGHGGMQGLGGDDGPSYDDPDAEGSSLVGVAVAEQLLGGRIISIDDRR